MNLDICSKFFRDFQGIWRNPGEIPHIGWMICGVKMVKGHDTGADPGGGPGGQDPPLLGDPQTS